MIGLLFVIPVIQGIAHRDALDLMEQEHCHDILRIEQFPELRLIEEHRQSGRVVHGSADAEADNSFFTFSGNDWSFRSRWYNLQKVYKSVRT